MKYHYVYQIIELNTNKKYIGSRSSNILPSFDIGNKYFSSSRDKEFLKNQKENPSNYKYEVLSIFESREDALTEEVRLHALYNVGINEEFINRAKQTATKFITNPWNKGKSTPLKGKTYEEIYGEEIAKELKEKRRLAKLGTIIMDEQKEKQKQSIKKYYEVNESPLKGTNKSAATKEKIKNKIKEQWENKTEDEINDFKQKRTNHMTGNTITKDMIWVNNGTKNKRVKPDSIPLGFVKGRLI